MSHLNGYLGPHREISETEWQELRRVSEGELTPGAVANVLRRVVSNFEHLSTDQLRQRCLELCILHDEWSI